jgi:hypothetical protein
VDDTFFIWPHGSDKLKRLPEPPKQYHSVHSFHHGV